VNWKKSNELVATAVAYEFTKVVPDPLGVLVPYTPIVPATAPAAYAKLVDNDTLGISLLEPTLASAARIFENVSDAVDSFLP
jgi:hypothetical protein